MALYRGMKDNSFMWKHCQERHGGVIRGDKDFRMEPVDSFRDPLPRILQEAVLIQHNESNPRTKNLNSKMEYFGPEYIRPAFAKGPVDQY